MEYSHNENFAPRTEEEWDIYRKKVQKEMEEEYLKDREKAMELLEPRLELLQAFKEGKTIQAFFENAWRDLYMGTFPSSWLFPIDTYRIKEISKFGKPPLNATPSEKETVNDYLYSIKDSTDNELKSVQYAYGQFIHNAVSGDFAETNAIMDAFRARITKKPQRVSIPATSEELDTMKRNIFLKDKLTCIIFAVDAEDPNRLKENYWKFNPDTKCWEDWENK